MVCSFISVKVIITHIFDAIKSAVKSNHKRGKTMWRLNAQEDLDASLFIESGFKGKVLAKK